MSSKALSDEQHRRGIAKRLLAEQGQTFASKAGIDLQDQPAALWQLLVTTMLLSARINASVALATAHELWRCGWTTPRAMANSHRHDRVAALGRGGYRRYDERTATRLAAAAELAQSRWQGDLRRLHDQAQDAAPQAQGVARQSARLLQEFDGIGPVGADIFLREVQQVWADVRPYVDKLVLRGAERCGLPADAEQLAALADGEELANLCAALVRVAKSGKGVAKGQS